MSVGINDANTLEIDMVNLWPNLLSGDAALPGILRWARTNMDIWKFNPISSGLLGPVTIQRVVLIK